jgi:GDP-L-fucose synthase
MSLCRDAPRVVVTGGGGMLGAALYELHPEWIYLTSGTADLRDPVQAYNILRAAAPDTIVHLAAKVAGMHARIKDKCGMLEDNLLINTNVVRAARRLGVRRIVAILDASMYPEASKSPMSESDVHSGPPPPNDVGYAYAKRMLEVHCKLSGISCLCLASVNLYGPNDTFDSEKAHVVASLVMRAVAQRSLMVRGTGSARRQFMFAPDFARIIQWAVGSDHVGTLNVAIPGDAGTSISGLASVVSESAGLKGTITHNVAYEDGRQSKLVDATAFEKVCPFRDFTPLREGIKRTLEWYEARVDRWTGPPENRLPASSSPRR